MNLKKLSDERLAELRNHQMRVIERWKPLLQVVEENYKQRGKVLSLYEQANIAQALQNSFDAVITRKGRVQEETDTSDISFARSMLPVIPALLPTLASQELAVIQTIDRPTSAVYLMNIVAANAKGSLAAGDTLIGAKTGASAADAARYYASDIVADEKIGDGDGSTTSFTHDLAKKPVIPGSCTISYTISSTTHTVTDNGSGGFSGTGISAGSINYTTGHIALTFSTAPDNNTAVMTDEYRFDVEAGSAYIDGIDVKVVEEVVTSQVFPIRIDYSVLAQLMLQKVHGIALQSEAVKFATQMVRFAIDQRVFDKIIEAASGAGAATGPGTFTVTAGSGQEYIWRINEIKRYISKASMNIFAKTLRATGNVILGGVNFCAALDILENNGFKPALRAGQRPPAGPYVYGTLGNRTVVCNPFMNANKYVVAFRGDHYLFAGTIYAPFIPFYSTPSVTLANLKTQQGFMSQGAIKVINAGMYSLGEISGF